MSKIRIGIFFGGGSREREISFAGGRTVYDNLDKTLFEPVPVFCDSIGRFILCNWEFIYKGTIRDFYPPVEFLPEQNGGFQIYAESLNLDEDKKNALASSIGIPVLPTDFKKHFDFAFLCLHGPGGEDGTIQGLLESLNVPYSGSGILPSSIGINKAIQKGLMVAAGFNSPEFLTISRDEWKEAGSPEFYSAAVGRIGKSLVIKASNQGSSIGVSILHNPDEEAFINAVNRSFFIKEIDAAEFNALGENEQPEFVRTLCDIREGIGIPMTCGGNVFYHPVDVLAFLRSARRGKFTFESVSREQEVLVEGFIEGREFSCIVIQDETGRPIALPPTEIRKGKELFDYRSKYLPGLSRKITPIDLPTPEIESIRHECERLFSALKFDVYARIDGFITSEKKIFLNDPNTTSGMMPSSFFFHQAAEIGLNPSRFLTFIIRTSLMQRAKLPGDTSFYSFLLSSLDEKIREANEASSDKIRVAVILGGYSSERHISVESGRNIYEKLSSSSKYQPLPVFLTGGDHNHELYLIPVNVLLKDNADDIKEKVLRYETHPVVSNIKERCSFITRKYSGKDLVTSPRKITYEELASMADAAFIALHGRPGEDGQVQRELEKVDLPFNGSGAESSTITIDKFTTNEILRKNGFLVAEHMLVEETDWSGSKDTVLKNISEKIGFPFIAKPVDDGCSSAVRKIKTREELEAFAELIFRKQEELDPGAAGTLKIKPKEEFPRKKVFLVEELISPKGANHFLEITGGMLTRIGKDGELIYEVFEASEALAEGEVLSLEEKFLAGQGQNITPARYSKDPEERAVISGKVKETLGAAARLLNIKGYTRIDAFVRVFDNCRTEVIFIEVNSLPGMTPATCIFHQAAISHYKPFDFIDKILEFAFLQKKTVNS